MSYFLYKLAEAFSVILIVLAIMMIPIGYVLMSVTKYEKHVVDTNGTESLQDGIAMQLLREMNY